MAIQQLNKNIADLPQAVPESEVARHFGVSVQLTGVYHNLIRQWAEL